MDTRFNNQSSHCLFIGDRNLEEVIAKDKEELVKLNGSFEAVADKMDSIVDFVEKSRRLPQDFDDKIMITNYVRYRGIQECPFDGDCRIRGYIGWNEDVKIKNKKTARELTINSGTAHLARQHHLLEKDNIYGISAEEFYESFM